MGELPPKLFFRIGEVAGLVGVEPHVLRYWEREFRSIRPTKSAKGQRVYSRKDVENLLRVRDLLYRDGFTIAGAKKKLQRAAGVDDGPALDVEDESSDLLGLVVDEPAVVDEVGTTKAGVEASLLHSGANEAGTTRTEKLVALRTEVEAFLMELSRPDTRRGNSDA